MKKENIKTILSCIIFYSVIGQLAVGLRCWIDECELGEILFCHIGALLVSISVGYILAKDDIKSLGDNQ